MKARLSILGAILATAAVAAAATVTLAPLPPPAHPDTEATTNCAMAAWSGLKRTLHFTLAFDATPSNNVQIAFGRDADTFGYNARTEITAASILSNAYTHAYDDIGNHTTSTVNSATTAYTANQLNQYTAIANGDTVEPEYDLDGNLLSDGVFSYAYDAENRLVTAYSNSVCIISNAYDHASRRAAKWTPSHTTTFIYDGWNLVQEVIQDRQSTVTNRYVWGNDLSGSLQGAGGVGGLLAVSLDGAWRFPFYDANGNVTAYVDENGATVASYTYDAFGATIAQSGALADTFNHRFSTKYFDAENQPLLLRLPLLFARPPPLAQPRPHQGGRRAEPVCVLRKC